MSNDNGQEPKPEPTIDFEVFETFYKKNPDLDNKEYYEAFPKVNQGTLRYWKSKARESTSTPTPSQQSTSSPTIPDEKVQKLQQQLLDTLMSGADVRAKALAQPFIDKKDLDSAILLLQENAKIQTPAPNTPTIPTPTGMPKPGLEKYMRYVPGSDKISWEIPATVLLDPEKNKKLGEYQ